jgi:hypothetical protein
MIYLIRSAIDADSMPIPEIAVSENDEAAAKYEARGFVRCSFETYREAWRLRHTRTFERLRAVALNNIQIAMAVGAYPALE